jgi:hypothetical protein
MRSSWCGFLRARHWLVDILELWLLRFCPGEGWVGFRGLGLPGLAGIASGLWKAKKKPRQTVAGPSMSVRGGRLSFSLHVSNTVLVLIAQAKRLTSG